MKLLYCIFVSLIALRAVPAAYARVLSVRPGDELAAFLTIYNNYGKETSSPPLPPSDSPSQHQAGYGATANSDSKMSRNADLAAPQISHGQSDLRISRNTASPPPSPKPSPTPVHKTRAPPPPPKKSPTPIQRKRAPPPPPKGSTTPTQRTRAPPPLLKPTPSYGQQGISRSRTIATGTSSTPSSKQFVNQMTEKFSGTIRAPPPPPNSPPPDDVQLGSTLLCNKLVSDYGCRKPRVSSS